MTVTEQGVEGMPLSLLAQWYAAPDDWVRSAMVMGLDGSYVDAAGSSRGLSGPADLAALRMMRALADVVVVGAATALREGYVPGRLHPDAAPFSVGPTRLALVSRALDLPDSGPLWDGERPIIITEASPDPKWELRLRDLASRADVIDLAHPLTGAAIVEALRARGLRHVLCEGGSTVQHMMRADASVDELAVTVTAQVGGTPSLASGALGQAGGRYDITHIAQSGAFTFLRCRLLHGVPTLVA